MNIHELEFPNDIQHFPFPFLWILFASHHHITIRRSRLIWCLFLGGNTTHVTVNEIATLTFPHLWIGQLEDEYIVRIELIGIKSHKAIKELQLPDELLLVDFLDGWANELARGFKQTILTLVLSIVVIVIWLYLWTRRLNSILIALIPIASSLFNFL